MSQMKQILPNCISTPAFKNERPIMNQKNARCKNEENMALYSSPWCVQHFLYLGNWYREICDEMKCGRIKSMENEIIYQTKYVINFNDVIEIKKMPLLDTRSYWKKKILFLFRYVLVRFKH